MRLFNKFRSALILAATTMCMLAQSPLFSPVTFVNPSKYDWYVDKLNGSNANSGHTRATAFATIAFLMSQGTLAAGQRIGIARGTCQWYREQITLSATSLNRMTIEGYGTGALPILDGSNIITGTDPLCGQTNAGTWTLDTGTTWSTPISLDADGNGSVNFWIDNAPPPPHSVSLATCESTVGTYWVVSDFSASTTLYYNSGSASNPGSDGHLYEYGSRTSGIAGNGITDITVNNIQTQKNHTNDGSLVLGYRATLNNVIANWGTKHNILVGDGSTLTNVQMHDSRYWDPAAKVYSQNDQLIIYSNVSLGLGLTINGLTCSNYTLDFTINCSYAHDNGGASVGFGTVNWSNVTATNESTALDGVVSSLNGMTATNSGAIVLGYGGTFQNIVTVGSVSNAIQICPCTTPGPVVLTNVNLSGNSNTGVIKLVAASGLTMNGTNVISNAFASGTDIWVSPTITLTNLNISGTTFMDPQSHSYVNVASGHVPASVSFSNNTYHYGAGGFMNWLGTFYSFANADYTTWQGFGFDVVGSTRVNVSP